MEKYRYLPAIALLLMLAIAFNVPTNVRADQTGTGTINVTQAVAPTVNSTALTGFSGGLCTATNNTALDTATEYCLSVVVSEPVGSLLTNLKNITTVLYADGYFSGAANEIRHRYEFNWTYSTGVSGAFAVVGPTTPRGPYFISGDAQAPSLNQRSGIFNFTFKLDHLAIFTSAGVSPLHWNSAAYVTDKVSNEGWKTDAFDVNLYQTLVIDSAVTWTGIANSTDNHGTKFPGIWNYTANYMNDFNISASGNPTSSFGDSFPIANVHVATDAAKTGNQVFTVTSTEWGAMTSLPNNFYQSENVYWFVDIPANTPTGTYVFDYYAANFFAAGNYAS